MYPTPGSKFRPEEFFPPSVIREHTTQRGRVESKIWRLLDNRLIWTVKALRYYFDCPMYLNNYCWGGDASLRVYRPVLELIDFNKYNSDLQKDKKTAIRSITPRLSSFTSQHCHGRAVDATFKKYSAEEIRDDIRKSPTAKRYQYITAVEEGVGWLHVDTRPWDGPRLFFKPR
jgi:hypothetical protein